ncbi:hypothetical protein [Agromyces sp. ZXT2-3]|uniref:hypothetical protein n=1 Tax=Agromyces sp. ZXT2-3 TaxID=3461152 RepID=UPI004054FA13
MSGRAFVMEYPERESYGEVMKGYFSLMRGFGLEFASRSDRVLGGTMGASWFRHYQEELKQEARLRNRKFGRVSLSDPSFFLNDFLYTEDSLFRKVIENTGDVRVLAKKIVDTRNTWVHFSEEPTTAQLLDAAVLVRQFGEKNHMGVAGPAAQLVKRVTKIQNGRYPPVPKPTPPTDVVTPQPETDAAEPSSGAGAGEPPAAIPLPEPTFERRPPIGGTWIGDIPRRRVRVTKTRDVVDIETGRSLRPEIDGDPNEKLRQWTSARPMGELWVAGDGAVGGYVRGVPRLLGYLGPDPVDEVARGFLLPRFYDLVDDHLIDLDSGVRLQEAVDGDTAQDEAQRLDRAVAEVAHAGGTIRLTNFGDLLYLDDDGMQRIAVVNPTMWFPSHFIV